MSNIILVILEVLGKIIGFFIGKEKSKVKTPDELRLEEDKQLADAIKRGDCETVAKIRERRRKYPNL